MTSLPSESNSFARSLARFRRGYNAFFALLDDFPEALRDRPGACGEWSPRQILAHLNGWIEEAQQRFQDFDAGDTTNRTYNQDDDWAAFNGQSVQSRDHLSWEEIVVELRKAVHLFSLQADQIAPERVATDARYEEWLIGLWNDCIDHMGQLCRFIREQ